MFQMKNSVSFILIVLFYSGRVYDCIDTIFTTLQKDVSISNVKEPMEKCQRLCYGIMI